MSAMSVQALRRAVVEASMSEPLFRKALEQNAQDAISRRFGAQPVSCAVYFERATEWSVLLPQMTDELTRSIGRVVSSLGARHPTRGEFEALLLHRASIDPAFRRRLTSDPQAAVLEELQRYGEGLPSGMTVRVYEEAPDQCAIVVPSPMGEPRELAENELAAVVGGGDPPSADNATPVTGCIIQELPREP